MPIAFLYPGQGSQQPGMGTQLLQDDEVSALCDRCSSHADVDLRRLLTEAGEDELRLTQNAQPALCFMGLGLTLLLRRSGLEPEAAAGTTSMAAVLGLGGEAVEKALQGLAQRQRRVPHAADGPRRRTPARRWTGSSGGSLAFP